MPRPIVGAAPKQNKPEQWTDEQRAFVVYHKSLGAPASGITPLLNTQFGISRTEGAVIGCIIRVHKEEGDETRLLEIANQYSWQKTANEGRNALNRTADGKILYTDEQRAYALYFFALGLPVKHIASLFNREFSLDVCFSTLEKLIRRTRSKQKEREEILKNAEQYPWYTDPIPENHRPLTPTRRVRPARTNSTNDSGVIAQENQPSPSPDWTKEQRAFLIHHSYRGMKQDVLLENLNSTFGTNLGNGSMMAVLSWIWRHDELVAQLRQHAEQFDWYTPEAAPGTPESRETEKAQRMHDARKRASEKKEWYKKVPKDVDFSRFLLPERTDNVRRSLVESGSYSSRPIKIGDSDDNDDKIPGISGFRRISSDYGSGRESDLLNTSPLSLKPTDARTVNFKSECHDSLLPSMPKFRWIEPRPSDVSGRRANNLQSMSPLEFRTTNDRPTNAQGEVQNSHSTGRPEEFLTASSFSAESPMLSMNYPRRPINTSSVDHPFRPDANFHSTNANYPSSLNASFNSSSAAYSSRPNTAFNPQSAHSSAQLHRPNANFNSSSSSYAATPNASFNSLNTSQSFRPRIVNPASTNIFSHPHATVHPPSNLSAYGPISTHHAPNVQPPSPTPSPPGTPPPRVHDVLLAWAPKAVYPSTSRRQVPALERRSRSPRVPKEERFGFGDSDDDGTDERRFLQPTRREMRDREPLERSERRG